MRYEIVWIKESSKWAVKDKDKDGFNQYIFWADDKESCEKYIRDLKDEESQVSLF